MLNAEKFKDEILECIDEYNSGRFSISKDCVPRFKYCEATYCKDCMLSEQEGYCSLKRTKWLLSEYKEPIKLSRLEYEILKYLQKKKNAYISRSKNGELVVHRIKPISKENAYWKGMDISYCLKTFEDDLFHFVKWEDEEPTLIKEVLNNCEVVEDD